MWLRTWLLSLLILATFTVTGLSADQPCKGNSCESLQETVSLLQMENFVSKRQLAGDGLNAIRSSPGKPVTDSTSYKSFFKNSNYTMDDLIDAVVHEIEFELGYLNYEKTHRIPQKSKIVISLIEGFLLPAFIGVDRCYMGQCCLGFGKAFTLGGLGFWFLLDYCLIVGNSLARKEKIDSFGYWARFDSVEINYSFFISFSFLLLMCCGSVLNNRHIQQAVKYDKPPEKQTLGRETGYM